MTTPAIPTGVDTSGVPTFPAGFTFGSATASYQIEGAVHESGRGVSVWDTFSHAPGKVARGDTGDVACDHYHRYPEDVALMADAGLQAYRFSMAWPRVVPEADGVVNAAGLDFYDRLVDSLLARGIQPWVTLFHWDLPQWAEDAGGWLARDTVDRYLDYARASYDRLGDRVHGWITFNEMFVHAVFGYAFGIHAPGRTLLLDAFPAIHHQMLAHGRATTALREAGAALVGVTHNLATARTLGDPTPESDAARHAMHLFHGATLTDPLFHGRYPEGIEALFGASTACVRDGDTAAMAAPLDFLGVNYYFPDYVRAPGPGNPLPFEMIDGREVARELGTPTTEMGWPVLPDGLHELLVELKRSYGDALPPLYITENGVAYPDVVVDGGGTPRIHDTDRIAYLDAHLRAIRRAIADGVDVQGYFCWSFLDNFEWAEGYRPRFGLTYVDYDNGQRRIPKDSLAWYAAAARAPREA